MGDLLATAFGIYDNLRSGRATTANTSDPIVNSMFGELKRNAGSMSLHEWLDAIPEFKRITMISSHPLIRIKHNTSGNLAPSMVVAFVKGVRDHR